MVRADGKRRWGLSGVLSLSAHAALVAAVFAGGMSRADSRRSSRFVATAVVETTVVVQLVTPTELTETAPEASAPEAAAAPRRVRVARRARPREVPTVIEPASDARPVETSRQDGPDEEAPGAEETPSPSSTGASGGARTAVAAQAPQPVQHIPPIVSLKWGYRRVYQSFPRLPNSLSIRGKAYSVELQLCVAADGQVSQVGLRRGAARELDELVVANARTWRYRPFLVDGKPHPFCHLIKIDYEVE
jgi:hypothetical protein